MGKQETSSFRTSQYSVRISRTADEGGDPLGTGTLLIRREDETVWLLTCAHVFFPKRWLVDGTEAESDFFDKVAVEYKAAEARGRTVTIILKDPEGETLVSAGTIMAGKWEEPESCDKDYICVKLDWEDWMGRLDDTQLGLPDEGRHYIGYGFPNIVNTSRACDSGRWLETKSSNVSKTKFTVQYEHDPSMTREEEMNSFSGGGLFDSETNELVGILCQPYGEANNEAWAVAACLLEKEWNRSQPIFWEDACLVRRIHTPFGNESILPSMRLTLNLFAVLSGIQNGAVIFLLNSEGKTLNCLLNQEKLQRLIPCRTWKSMRAGDKPGLALQRAKSLVVNMSGQEQDWKNAERLAGDLNLTQWGIPSKLVLFNIDLATEPQEAPPDIQKLVKRISEKVMGTEKFYLFSTANFIESLSDFEANAGEETDILCRQAEQREDPYTFFLQETAHRPHLLPWLIAQCTQPGSPPLLRSAVLRLTILYGTLTNGSGIYSILLGSRNKELFWEGVYPELPADEKLDFLGRLAMDRPNEDFWEQAVGETATYDENIVLFARALRKLVKKPVWSSGDLEDIRPRLFLPGAFRTLVRCLNRRNAQPERDSQALLELLSGSRETVLYWQFLLSCRWETETLCRRIQGSADGQFLSLLLDTEPAKGEGAWPQADSMRAELFGPHG